MSTKIKTVVSVVVLATTTLLTSASIAAEGKQSAVDTLTTNRYTQALIDRMDTTRDGKVSKAEFMKFMEAEWNALDKNKNGVLETIEFQNREYFQRREAD